MKRAFFVVFLFMFCMVLPACKTKEEQKDVMTTSLLDAGSEIISLMDEMINNESYQEVMASSSDLESAFKMLAVGDYSKASAVYEIHIPDRTYDNFISINQEGDVKNDMSEKLYTELKGRMTVSLANMINGRYNGASYLAASSIVSASKVFVNTELEESKVFLYTFETGFPIMISYVKGDGGAVTATGYFLMNENLVGATKDDIDTMVKDTFYLSGSMVELVE